MKPDRWQKVKEIFQAAMDRAPAERSVFVSDVCDGDEELRQEVESLMSSDGRSGTFLDAPAYEAAAEMIVDNKSGLKKGRTIGPFEILSFISRGGMGEVYLAHDPRLSRKVALKILPETFTKNLDRLRRFEQEARAASALNHPNIITVYEILKTDPTHVIATEFVEGETLRQRLAHAKLTLPDSLHIAVQVADALAAAHKVGIIHRDIKPENIMLRPDGYVKVLDFGLAKLAAESPNIPMEEALTKQVRTGSGVVIGTAAYMSPEQARGKPVDARSDIFSLGAVIYEMVTGHKPFEGETPSDILAAILKSEPAPLSEFVADLPPELGRITTKTLRKDREERYQVVKDLLIDLKSLAQDLEFERRVKQMPDDLASPSSAVQTSTRTVNATRTDELDAVPTLISKPSLSSIVKPRRWPTVALVVLIVAGASFGIYKLWTRSREITPPVVTNIARVTAWSGLDAQPTLSPDGNSVAYSSNHNGTFEIYIKQLTPGGREIQLTSDGQENFQPSWSSDGQRIAYYSKNRGGIWIVPTSGGAARQLTEFGSTPKWSHDGAMIAFQSDGNADLGSGSVGSSTIWVVSAQGGAPRQVTKIGNPVGGHVAPTWSADDRRIAFVDLNYTTQQIWSVSIDGSDVKQLSHRSKPGVVQQPGWKDPLEGRAADPLYAPDGQTLYFVIGAVMWMLPISHDDEPAASPIRITDAGASVISSISLSADGKRVAYSVQTLTSNVWSLPLSSKTYEATGNPKQLTNQTGARNTQPAFSPDGKKLAFIEFLRGGQIALWHADANGENATPTTASGYVPNWFPDGDQIAYISNREKHWAVWATSLRKGNEHLLYSADKDIQYARLSADGKQLAFNLADSAGIINLWTVPISGGQPKQLTFDKELAGFPSWSPDRKFIAYQMKRGDDGFLMIISSEGGTPTQVTSGHGRSWPYSFSPDGDKILFAGERNGIWNVWWISRSTKEQKQLTSYTKPNAYVRYPAWSPLGTQMAYEYSEITGNIWLMDLK
jgi:Tol biopolymer transport system component